MVALKASKANAIYILKVPVQETKSLFLKKEKKKKKNKRSQFKKLCWVYFTEKKNELLITNKRNHQLEHTFCIIEKVVPFHRNRNFEINREGGIETYRNITVTVHFHLWSCRLVAFGKKRLLSIFIKFKII